MLRTAILLSLFTALNAWAQPGDPFKLTAPQEQPGNGEEENLCGCAIYDFVPSIKQIKGNSILDSKKPFFTSGGKAFIGINGKIIRLAEKDQFTYVSGNTSVKLSGHKELFSPTSEKCDTVWTEVLVTIIHGGQKQVVRGAQACGC